MTNATLSLPNATLDLPINPAAACGCGVDAGDVAGPVATTRTEDFLAAVRATGPDRRLVFLLDGTPLVAPGYHVTEVKAVSYETMDCGGLAARWQETVIQIWNPGDDPVREHMAADKFLAIYDRVAAHVSVSPQAELRFEYGDCARPAVSYHVGELEETGETLAVHLRAPGVTCKALDREREAAAAARTDGGTANACCGG